ncbi:MAG: heparinase II/III-family protein [Clostridiales bacterium]|jgi:hypothetical protein|nr:heparinase II/III-family protein [Clostridiales bacterium]
MLTYDAAFWSTVKTDGKYKNFRDALAEVYANLCGKPAHPARYSDFKIYFETGDRKTFEDGYHARRRQLAAAAVMFLIHGEEQYRVYMQDLIWAICDEYSWCVPAHIHASDAEGQIKAIDLFASETGFVLSEIITLLGDQLDAAVVNRVKYEVHRRVIARFLETPVYWWETARSNWAAVCACQVAGAFLYLAPELFPQARQRLDAAMDCFLESFGGDGACLEGLSYWIYGFGMFVMYHELLVGTDPNALEIFKDEKVANIAAFFQKSSLRGGITVTFADAQPNALYDPWLGHYLKKIYGDLVKLPPLSQALPLARLRFSSMVRGFLYFDPSENETELPLSNCYLPDAQWFLRENGAYSLAAKGGHNAEPHNHNDIGSFLLCVNGRQVLCDIGVGVYTKQYFSAETRYTMLGNGSQGHSVPIINGGYQRAGAEYRAEQVSQSGDTFTADILGAYGEKGSLVRTFEALEHSVIITDEYALEQQPSAIVERFVSYEMPAPEAGKLVWRDAVLEYDAERFTPSVSEEKYENNFMGKVSVYLIDLTAIAPQRAMTARFRVTAAANG